VVSSTLGCCTTLPDNILVTCRFVQCIFEGTHHREYCNTAPSPARDIHWSQMTHLPTQHDLDKAQQETCRLRSRVQDNIYFDMWQVTNNLSLSSSYISFRKSLLHWFFFLLFPYMYVYVLFFSYDIILP